MKLPNTNKRLSVRLLGYRVGELRQLDTGRLEFAYLPEYLAAAEAFAISMSMPLRKEPFGHDPAAAFFGGYLTDDPHARRALSKLLHISERNDFALLAEIGRDCAGAISLHPPDDPVIPDEDRESELQCLSLSELADHVARLRSRPLFVDPDGKVRLSLAGVQPKAAIVMRGSEIFLPLGGTPSTHIVKASVEGVEDHLINEHFSLELARASGLPAPKSELYREGGVEFLVVERYDRAVAPTGRVIRIHQEDFCQALGLSPDRRYEFEGGPSLRDAFALLERTDDPVRDRLGFLDAVIFNAMLGNVDAHAKNFSLLYREGRPRLAPLYDLTALRVYETLHGEPASRKMAMKIAKKAYPEELYRRHWERFAQANGLSPAAVLRQVTRMADRVVNGLDRTVSAVSAQLHRASDMPERIAADVPARAELMAEQVRQGAKTMESR